MKKNKMTEAQIKEENVAIGTLVEAVFAEMASQDNPKSYTSKDFRASKNGKQSLAAFFKATHKIYEETEDETKNEEDAQEKDPEEKLEESLFYKNLAATDHILEAAISVWNLYEGKDLSAEKFTGTSQGKRAVSKYLKEATVLLPENLMKESEEEMTHCEEEDDDPTEGMSEEELAGLDNLVNSVQSFLKQEAEEADKEEEPKQESEEPEDHEHEEEDGEEKEVTIKIEESTFHRFAKSDLGKKALVEYANSLKKGGLKLGSKIEKKLSKIAGNHNQVFAGILEEAFKKSPLVKMGTLNESQTSELSSLVLESVNEIAGSITDSMKKEMLAECEAYVNTEVIPTITESFDKTYIPMIMNEMAEGVDNYLEYTARQFFDEMSKDKMVVKSRKSVQLESFETKLLNLIKEELTVVPEQEDEVERLAQKNEELRNDVTEAKLENVKMANKIFELRKENYVIMNLPANFSEATKEKLLGYAQDVLWESCDNMDDFKEAFDKAVDDAAKLEDEGEKEIEEAKKNAKRFKKESEEPEANPEETKQESEEVCPDCGNNPCTCKQESEEEKEPSDIEKLKEAVLRLGGLREEEEEEPEEKQESEEPKKYEDDPEDPLDEKMKRLGKKKN